MDFHKRCLPGAWRGVTLGLALSMVATLASASEPSSTDSPPPPTPPAVEFGVVVSDAHADQDVRYLLGQLDVRSWYSFDGASSPLDPPGLNRVFLLRTGDAGRGGPSEKDVTALARAHPGHAWMIGNEPNVAGQDNISPEAYAQTFHTLYGALKTGDPSAIVVGPNVLNWDFTCVGCPGYVSGHAWVDAFRAAYTSMYGIEPPVDVWGIHAYDINWQDLPMVRVDHIETDLSSVRDYLRAIPGQENRTVWLTEFGIIWAFDGIAYNEVDGATRYLPAGKYQTQQVNGNLSLLVDWLQSQGPQLGIGRAFLYATHPPAEPYASDTAGISLFDASGAGAQLTATGESYRDAIHSQQLSAVGSGS